MNLTQSQPAHRFTPVITTRSSGEPGGKKTGLPVTRENRPYCDDFNQVFGYVPLTIPATPPLDESIVLFHRDLSGELRGLHSSMMGTGRIADIIGLKDVIPDSGPVDIQLLGMLIFDRASKRDWLGADYGCARALCHHQKNMPKLPHFDRLQFLFPGTIVFDDAVGICIPVVHKDASEWVIRHRSVLENAVPGVDLLVHLA
jgi:hypothetical protein